jgi:hypothetical protein
MPVPSYQDKTCGCGAIMPAGGPEWARGSCDACAEKKRATAEPPSDPDCAHPNTVEGARYEFCLDCGAARLLSARSWEPYTWTEARS